MNCIPTPIFSIITVTYNSEKYLEQTIKSVLSQDFQDFEYIIIDGGSTDKTLDIINKYSNSISYWVSEKDNGIYDAINKGIRASKGKYIGIINSDDWYEEGSFLKISNVFEDIQIDILCGLLRLWEDNYTLGVQGNASNFLKYGMISHPTCFVKREVYEKVGLFNSNFKIAGDYDFMMRCFNNNCSFHFLEVIIANFRTSGISNSDTITRLSEFNYIQLTNKLISNKKYRVEKFKLFLKRLL